jgi:hypothetical protein
MFSDSLTALSTVMPGMGLLAVLAHLALRPKREANAAIVDPRELVSVNDPAGLPAQVRQPE